MRICVLGAGVVGVSTAFALARLGHDVTVIDRHRDAAGGASHANGAQLSYSYVDPLAGPAILKSLPRYFLGMDRSVRMGIRSSSGYLSWGLKFLGNCTPGQYRANLRERAALSRQSAMVFNNLVESLPTGALKPSASGKFVLVDTEKQLENEKARQPVYSGLGLDRKVVNRTEALTLSPVLAGIMQRFCGGVYSRTDLALDPAAYCAALVSGAQNFGTTFMFGEAVTGFAVTGGQVTGVRTANGCLPFDRVIVCAGNGTPELLVPLGVPVPVYPVRGYSFTLPSGEKALSVSVTSLRHKIVYADLGDTVRVAGFFDINRATSTIASRLRELLNLARRIWPDAADYDHPCSEWTGCRPMTPSGVPVTGESPVKNLYINAGHGSLGYTFAAGSAARIAAMIGPANERGIPDDGEPEYAAQ